MAILSSEAKPIPRRSSSTGAQLFHHHASIKITTVSTHATLDSKSLLSPWSAPKSSKPKSTGLVEKFIQSYKELESYKYVSFRW